MKTALVLFTRDALEQFPYLHYIYDAIIELYQSGGSCQVVGFQDLSYQKIASHKDLSLLLIELPATYSIKKGLWEKVNFPALVRQLFPHRIYYLGHDLPVLKTSKGAEQWRFVADLTRYQLPGDAKASQLNKQKKLLGRLSMADKIISYSDSAVAVLRGLPVQPPLADYSSWIPWPKNEWLQPSLYTEEAMEHFKHQNTGDAAYFLIDGRGDREAAIIEYLKAFSHFKKWQRSSMQLALLIPASLHKKADFLEKIETYFYKADVHLLSDLDTKTLYGWIRSAYAVVTPSLHDKSLDIQLAAASLETLIVAPDTPACRELLPGARFDLAATDKESLGQVLISCYKSEILRARHIRAGQECREKWPAFEPSI